MKLGNPNDAPSEQSRATHPFDRVMESFASLLDNLLNVWAHQSQVWVTLSHQEAWQVSQRNAATGTVNWHFTNDEASGKVKRLYPFFTLGDLT